MMKTIHNTKTGQTGLIVKETLQYYKVAYLHNTIKNAHQYGYWKKQHCHVKEITLNLI